MKHMARLVSLLLALLMLASCAVAETQFPLTDKPVTLKIMAKVQASYPEQDLALVSSLAAYEKMTGVHIEWENVDSSIMNQQLSGAMSSGDMPDIIFKNQISNANLFKWGQQGLLVDIAPYLEEYAPNFSALLDKYPDIRQAVTAPDGAIYGFPQVGLTPEMRVPCKLFLNQKLMDAAAQKMPTTTDELVAVLRALRDLDYDGDGAADGIIPFVSSVDNTYRFFYGSFGLNTRGAHHEVVDVDPETGKLRVFATSDNYRKMVEYLAGMYAEGLIDPEMYTNGNKYAGSLASQHKLGSLPFTNRSKFADDVVDEWVGLKNVLVGPDGYQKTSYVRSNLHSVGNFVITTECKNVELAIQWVDYFYTDEGGMFLLMGEEGVNWQKDADGNPGYTEEALAKMTPDMTSDAFLSIFGLLPGGGNPCVVPAGLWFNEYEPESASTAQAMFPYINDIVWPIFAWTTDELKAYNTYHGDIKSYVKNQTALFVSGQLELNDDTWAAFLNEIDALGADKLLETYESALARIYGEGVAY